jgi:CheY-like chemotaxis protein
MPDSTFKKILVVDDEEEVVASLSNILRRSNYEVIATTKGKDAVELAKNKHPDLILLDVLMPDMSGDDVAITLSQNPATCSIPIIFLTAILTKEEQSSIKRTGRSFVIAKPVTGREILAMIKKVLG